MTLARRQLPALRRATGAAFAVNDGTPDVPAVPVRRFPASRERPLFYLAHRPARDELGLAVMRDPSVCYARHGTVESPGYMRPVGCAAWPEIVATHFPASDDEVAWSARGCAREVADTLYVHGHWRGYGAYGGGDYCGAFDLLTFGNFRGHAVNDITALLGLPADGVSETTPTAMAAKDSGMLPIGSTVNRGRFSFYRAAGTANAARWSEVFAEELVRQCDAYLPDGGGGPVRLCYPYHLALDMEEGPDGRNFHHVAWQTDHYARLADMRNHVNDPRYSTEVVWRDESGAGRTVKDWWDARVASGVGGGAWTAGLPLPIDKNLSDAEMLGLTYELSAMLKTIAHHQVDEALGSVLRGRFPGLTWSNFGSFLHRDRDRLPAAQLGYDWLRVLRADAQAPTPGYGYFDAAPASAPSVTAEQRVAFADAMMDRVDPAVPSLLYVPGPRAPGMTRSGWGGRADFLAVLKRMWERGASWFYVWTAEGVDTDAQSGLTWGWSLAETYAAINEFRAWVAGQLAGSRSRVRVARSYRGRGRVDEDVVLSARLARGRKR